MRFAMPILSHFNDNNFVILTPFAVYEQIRLEEGIKITLQIGWLKTPRQYIALSPNRLSHF